MPTGRVGLLGWPLGHSVSPAMHNAAFEALGIPWRYSAYPCAPADLPTHVARLLNEEQVAGLNVTVPHKQAVLALPQVTAIAPEVEAIGAANTLTRQPDDTLHASNTDWRGFAEDLAAHAVAVTGQLCLVLGTGGSAKAIAYALKQLGAGPVISVSRAANPPDVCGYGDLAELTEQAGLIVNCTPVGMSPAVNASPWPEGVAFPAQVVLYDLIYNPPRTRLMVQAEAAGARAIGGLGMLVRQGALAFEAWTGRRPPLDVMAAAAERALGLRPN